MTNIVVKYGEHRATCKGIHNPPKNPRRSATGYGDKIPTDYMVKFGKYTYRVYARCYGNGQSTYIIHAGNELFVDIEYA